MWVLQHLLYNISPGCSLSAIKALRVFPAVSMDAVDENVDYTI
jgi:hypothetical protein